ncbi:hypothetical protein FXO38_13091 [Capsicum annuum]|nr:hypothetical protein FXO38_13091 [Capsicum annuum]KAF3661283.1 hypothetical protein FXO37_12997 [Capsicum annuum]
MKKTLSTDGPFVATDIPYVGTDDKLVTTDRLSVATYGPSVATDMPDPRHCYSVRYRTGTSESDNSSVATDDHLFDSCYGHYKIIDMNPTYESSIATVAVKTNNNGQQEEDRGDNEEDDDDNEEEHDE